MAESLDTYGEYTSTWFDDRSYTNVQQAQRASKIAGVLRGHGVKQLDPVIVLMINSPDVTASFVAIWKLGAAICPVIPLWTPREIRYVMENSEAKIAITSPELAPNVAEAAEGVQGFDKILVVGETEVEGAIDILPEIDSADSFDGLVDCASDDLAMLLYTSGTTGSPKGVMLSQENVIFATDAMFKNNEGSSRFRSISVLPLSHSYGVMMMTLGARLGTSGRILRFWDTTAVFETIQELKVQRMALVPTMVSYMIDFPEREHYDVSSLERVGSGAAPLPEAARLEFEKLFGCTLMQGYGLSETAAALTGYRPSETYRVHSVGRPLPGIEACIMDFENKTLGAGETGEICTRGGHVMMGYLKNEEATNETVIDGWLHTGDVGHMDEDGYVYITDRKKDLIIKGGENISPKEIEEGIYAHPAVSEAAVFGVPDDKFGEELMAAVVLKHDQSATEEELLAHVAKHVTKFKVPRAVAFVNSLPKNATGKILKRVLREEFSKSALEKEKGDTS